MSTPKPLPTYNGQPPNQGRLIPLGVRGEGFAVLNLSLVVDARSPMFTYQAETQKALDAIACEASLGHTPATAKIEIAE